MHYIITWRARGLCKKRETKVLKVRADSYLYMGRIREGKGGKTLELRSLQMQKHICSEWDFSAEQTTENTCKRGSQQDWIACVQAQDELKISPGLLCCCGSVWEERRVRVRERAAVAMVSTGRLARRILHKSGRGWGGSFKMPFSLTRQPLVPPPSPHPPFPAFTNSLTHSLVFSVSVSFFGPSHSLLFLVTHSATTQDSQDKKKEQKQGTGVSRSPWSHRVRGGGGG